MFKFAHRREVLWPVTIKAPRPDGSGQLEESRIKIRYRLLTKADVESLAAAGSLSDAEKAARMDQVLAEHVLGWEGIVDAESGEAVPFSSDNLRALLDVLYVRAAIEAGLWEASRGAPAKN